ncbi:hypothetical protein RN053_22610 [Pantoea dispersa]|uniref:CHAT domain-containing protein n=1 Tax=Pantoea dispersa TaxID=59814 RepID=UPI0028DE4068|nr:CHAT domain-containing protein [Pantoea dispersa]MDT8853306.1 hypothetical protein [Pantoea dispersa]
MYHFYYEKEDKTIPAIKERFGFSDFHFLIDGILKNPNYSSTPIIGEIVEEIASVIHNPVFKSIASTRMYELKLTTLAISFLALQKRVPAIRLPNGVNHFLGKLQKLESISIDIGINDSEFQVKFKGLNTLMRRRLGKKLRDYISVNFNSISLVCDTPLDWFRFGELPLMLTHEISRINSTPGNILLQNASIYPMVNMNASELKKILVLRSFSFGEDIKFTLERALDVVLGNYKDIDIQIVDVQSEAEMISALNQFDGAVLVMDCHGDHGGTKKNGWLHLGEDEVDIWHLPKDVRIPPIVILSACLTSAISGSHASVANGFLKNGAVSVVGTLLPVNAIDSGVFVGRLLYRLTEFPKVLKKEFSHVTLRTLISLFLRMSYTTDVLRAFQISAVINPDDYERIHSLVNNEINSFNSDWNERMIDELFKSSHYSKERVRKFIDENCFFTETMCYSQIGFPECISINVRR